MRVRPPLLLLLWAVGVQGQILHLKVGLEMPSSKASAREAVQTMPAKRLWPGRYHLLLQFKESPGAADLEELERRGALVLETVPDNGLLVSVPDGFGWEGLALILATPPPAYIKWSPATGSSGADPVYMVEFYPDVSLDRALRVLQSAGLRPSTGRTLLPSHLLVTGEEELVRQLVEWDEVAYIFPAPSTVEAWPPIVCPGAITTVGPVGQYVATVGDGWDGPGRNAAQLAYYFEQIETSLPAAVIEPEIERALSEWSRYAKISFARTDRGNQLRTLRILFGRYNHGDSYPFDGPGRQIAHTFYPYPVTPEPLAGDLHFDADENWQVGAPGTLQVTDLFSVALHELGHALGLGHSDVPGSLMYPYYRGVDHLTALDIEAVRSLYADAGEVQPGVPEGERPLLLRILDPATETSQTEASTLSLYGIVTGGTSPVSVRWLTNRGAFGLAQGNGAWQVLGIPLAVGRNLITVTAVDAIQNQASLTVAVERTGGPAGGGSQEQPNQDSAGTPPDSGGGATAPTDSGSGTGTGSQTPATGAGTPAPSGGATGDAGAGSASSSSSGGTGSAGTPAATGSSGQSQPSTPTGTPAGGTDSTKPTVSIETPTARTVTTSKATFTVSGTASDNVGVTAVNWSTSLGKSGTCSGTSAWTADIPLLIGIQQVRIEARDAAGNTQWVGLTITRR